MKPEKTHTMVLKASSDLIQTNVSVTSPGTECIITQKTTVTTQDNKTTDSHT